MATVFNAALAAQLDDRGLGAAFAPDATYQAFLDVEKAVATAQGEIGMIPMASARVIAANCREDRLDRAHIAAGYRTTRHPLMPLIDELVRLCGPEHGGYVHWGITTQNVIQTGLLLLAKRAQATLDGVLRDILRSLGRLARTHAATTMAGRTHHRHAVPITFGFKVAVWIEELLQAADRLEEAKRRTFVVMTGGAVGCFSALGRDGLAMQTRVAELLDMGEMAIPSRAIRSHICEYANALGLMASVCHRIAEEVYQTSCEEYGELHEKMLEGAIGSSTMPQKINSVHCYGIIAGANRLYSLAGMLMVSAYRPFESDGSTNQLFEDGLVDVVAAAADVLLRTEALVRDLSPDAVRMRANMDLSHGAILGEYAMMRLGARIGKHRGHEMVHAAAVAAATGTTTFLEAIAALPDGAALRADIEERLARDGAGGVCKDYALHFGALAEAVDGGALPSPERRRLPIRLKATTP